MAVNMEKYMCKCLLENRNNNYFSPQNHQKTS